MLTATPHARSRSVNAVAAEPVHDRHQVHKAVTHGHVGDVGSPDLVGPGDLQIPQQIRVAPVSGRPTGGLPTRKHTLSTCPGIGGHCNSDMHGYLHRIHGIHGVEGSAAA